MPTMLLTDLSVRALKGSDKHQKFFDTKTPGFGIRVGKNSKTWVCMRGKQRELVTIGRYPDVSLSEARAEAKKLLSTAPDPKNVSVSFGDARDEFLKTYKEGRWKVNLTLLLKKFKALDHRQLSDLTDVDIKRCLDKVAGPSAQLHAYRAIRTFLKWCTRPPRRYLKHSPMEGYEAPSKDKKGTRILSDEELKAVWRASGEGSRVVYRLMILWGTRNAETALLARKWVKDDVLTVPGEYTKNGRDHGIPLLPLALEVLASRPENGPYYFPGRYTNETPINPMSLNRMRAEIQSETGTTDWQARDIRRTFRSNMARLKVPREICEVLINHAPPVLDEIYDRYDRIEEKREALAKYEAFMVSLLAEGTT